MKTLKQISFSFAQVAFAILSLLVLHSLLGDPGLALAAVTGALVGAGREADGPEEHRVPSVTDVITRLQPSRFPFTTFLDRLGRAAPCKQIKHSWPEISRYPREDAVNGATTAGAADASVDVTVDNGAYWRPNDILMAPDNATSPDAMYYVSAVSGSVLTVYAMPGSDGTTPYNADAFGTVPAFADGEGLYWVSNAKSEADTASLARQMTPDYKFNYVQTLDARVEISDHKMRSENFGTEDWLRQRRESLFEFRKSIENAMVFNGAPSIASDPDDGETIWLMAGLRHFVSSTISLPATGATETDLVSFVYEAFADQNGSSRKVFMAGENYCEVIDKVGADSATLQVMRDEKIAGVEIMSLKGRKGRLDTVYHPGFDEQGRSDEGVIVDLNHVVKRDYQAMEKRAADLKRSGDLKDAEAEYYITKTLLELRNAPAHKWCTLS